MLMVLPVAGGTGDEGGAGDEGGTEPYDEGAPFMVAASNIAWA